MWKFDIIHCPGKTNFFADATSRNPVAAEGDDVETAFMAANLAAIAITIDDVASAAKNDDAPPTSPLQRERCLHRPSARNITNTETDSTRAKMSSCTTTA